MNDCKPDEIIDRSSAEATELRRALAEARDELEAVQVIHGHMETELARLRAVLATAKQHAEAGNWNACKAALTGTGGDA